MKKGTSRWKAKGEKSDSEAYKLVNREVRLLAEVPGLTWKNPVKQVFTLFYRSTSAKRSTEILCPIIFAGKENDGDVPRKSTTGKGITATPLSIKKDGGETYRLCFL